MDWEVEDNGDGTFDVRRDRRPVAYDIEDWELGPLLLRHGVTEYVLIEADGYRTPRRA